MSNQYSNKGIYKNISNWHNFRLTVFAEGIATGIFAGLVISFFRWALHETEVWRAGFFKNVLSQNPLYIVLWFAALILVAFVLDRLTKHEPLAAGSGIPQVKGAIVGLIKMRWFPIMWVKLVAGIIGIGAGLSLGREGPSIQLGAVSAQGISRFLKRTRMEERYLMTSGASAGLAAAFNAPLAGVMFALEELHRSFSIVVLLPSMAAAFTATILSRFLFGRAPIFTMPDLQVLHTEDLLIVVLVAMVAGTCGVIFNKGLLNVNRFYALPIFKSSFHKIAFALFCAGVLGFYLPEVLGGGNNLINQLATTPAPLKMLVIFLIGKLIFTFISYGCGVPGGFFLPMLVIGALTGSVISNLLVTAGIIEAAKGPTIVVIAMAALFSSSVRAPITGTVLIMEMTSSYQQLLSLAVASMIAFVVAELWQSKPIYEELLARSLNSQKPSEAVKHQRTLAEFVVDSGSYCENKMLKQIELPPHTLIVDIKRGEESITPEPDVKLMQGDFIYVFCTHTQVEEISKLTDYKDK
ncbi:MAG: ClC family H(+)/Cl(-) exchange transporter [Phascolarctobacterium sp.]|nr:ClC family H(+)/Cl(-) exchange transporter [Phascolarctobacterium sp.]